MTAARPEATASAEFLRLLAGAADVDAVDDGLDRAQLGMDLVEEAALPTGSLSVLIRSSFSRGTMPVTSTTRSAGISISSPSDSRSRVVTGRPPVVASFATAGGSSSGTLRNTEPLSSDSS